MLLSHHLSLILIPLSPHFSLVTPTVRDWGFSFLLLYSVYLASELFWILANQSTSTTFPRWRDRSHNRLCGDVASSLPGLRCPCALSSSQETVFNKKGRELEAGLNGCPIFKRKSLSKYAMSLYWGKHVSLRARFKHYHSLLTKGFGDDMCELSQESSPDL